VAEPLSDPEFNRVVTAEDIFRLVIRGQAAIEAEVDAAMLASFEGEPPKLGELGTFGKRLKIAVAMHAVPPYAKELLEALSGLRNKVAHGVADDVPQEELERLRSALRGYMGDETADAWRLDEATARSVIWVALVAARRAVRKWSDFQREQRETEARLAALRRFVEQRREELAAQTEHIREQENP
jgi:hypothetical protein